MEVKWRKKGGRCLPEITQWLYAFSLCLSRAVIHLLHHFSRLGRKYKKRCAAPKTLLLLLPDSINTTFAAWEYTVHLNGLPPCLFVSACWLVRILGGNYAHWEIRLFTSLSSLSHKSSRPCALTEKDSQLKIRTHRARHLIGSHCCNCCS